MHWFSAVSDVPAGARWWGLSRRRSIRWSLAVLMLVMVATVAFLVWHGRQCYQETLATLNRYGRGEEVLCWPWDQASYRGVPVPAWFPHDIRYADNFDDEHIREFLQAAGRCRSLKELRLSSDWLCDDDFSPLHQLDNLRRLEVSHSDRFTGTGLRHLPARNSLVILITESTGFSDAGAKQLARCSRLQELELVNCRLTDAGLSELVRLTNLKRLTLESPYVTADGIAVLVQLRSLEDLWIFSEVPDTDNDDPITAEAVEELHRHMPWCRCSFNRQTWK